MDLRDLAYFEVIAETGNLGRAADRLGRTKPALSKCLRRLEASAGGVLFQRVGRRIALTALGQVLLDRARSLRAQLAELEREVRDLATGSAGHVRIGAGAVTADSLLPPVVSRLLADSPDITLEIVIGMGDVLRHALRRGDIDLIVSSVSWEQDDDLDAEFLWDDEVVVVANRDHELFRRPVMLQSLTEYGWVLPGPGVANRQWLDRAFARHGLPKPNVQIEVTSIQVLWRLIAETNLLSFISTRAVGLRDAESRLRAVPLAETTLRRKLGFVMMRGRYVAPAAQRLITFLRASADPAQERTGRVSSASGDPLRPHGGLPQGASH